MTAMIIRGMNGLDRIGIELPDSTKSDSRFLLEIPSPLEGAGIFLVIDSDSLPLL